jgi:hypothetical protein
MNEKSKEYLANVIAAVSMLLKAIEDTPAQIEPEVFKQLMTDMLTMLLALAHEEGITDEMITLVSKNMKELEDEE